MQILIARNLHGPRFGVGLTNSRVLLKTSRLRDHWRTTNGLRFMIDRRVVFVELWRPSFPARRRITTLYRRTSR